MERRAPPTAAAAIVAVAIAISAWPQTSYAQTPARAEASGRSLKQVEVVDPLFGLVAFRMSIPADWLFDAAVLRPHLGPAIVFRASTADGLTGLQLLPRYDWIDPPDAQMRRFYQSRQVPVLPPMRAEEFLRTRVLPEARPGVKVVGMEPLSSDKLAAAAAADRQQNAAYQAQAQGSRPKHQSTEGARIRIAYDFNAKPVEEVLVAWMTVYDLPGPHGVTRLSQALVTAARAPLGRLDAMQDQLIAMTKSAVTEPAWTARQNQFALQAAQAQQAAIVANGQRRLAENKAIFDKSMNTTAQMEARRHAGAMATADHMGDKQVMVNPATGRTGKVSNQYNYSYVDPSGNVVHSNSATYNPNAELRGNWTQLQPLK